MLNILEHPLLTHYLNILEQSNNPKKFRYTLSKIGSILATLSTSNFQLDEVVVEDGTKRNFFVKQILIVTIVPTGIFLLTPLLEIIPDAKIGYISYRKKSYRSDELEETMYLLPDSIEKSKIIIADYGIITGKTIQMALSRLVLEGITDFSILTVFATPEGIENVFSEFPNVLISTASLYPIESVNKITRGEYIDYLAEINKI
ncbi:MAG: uracil phosphoribosyltransferase [Candidatus Kapaibacteriales bacterium]